MKAKELVEQINAAKIASPHRLDNAIDMNGIAKVTEQDLDEHRWYIVGTIVYKVGNEFFGVSGPVSLKSESMTWNDVMMDCIAFEMTEVPSVTYVKKQWPT